MDAITLLHTRNSAPRLCEPAPEGAVLDDMLKAAFRAPDHSWLRPWRFLTIAGERRTALGQLFVAGAQQRRQDNNESPMEQQEAEKVAAKALRSPLIIVVVASIKEHPKVPAIEQVISAGCAAHGILLAAHAHGFAGVWRTGTNAYDETVKQGLGLQANEELVGFLYLGSVDGNYKPLRELSVDDFCQPWQ
ncbi:MAG TPA: nitroreductase [Porticoccus sp.]|nr:nitroreductase [Porticoccus sp.]